MRIGQADIDFEAHQINGPAGDYTIEPKVMEVLSVLIKNAGHVVTRESLIDQVWGGDMAATNGCLAPSLCFAKL